MSELKPCPFCGHSAYLESSTVRKGYEAVVHCSGCLAFVDTITYNTEEMAISVAASAWNRRTNGWIPVSERLPDYGESVLVAVIQVDGSRTADLDAMDEVNAFAGSYSHWMPLPAAPETEHSDG